MPILGIVSSSRLISAPLGVGAGYSTGVSGGIGRNINKLNFSTETTSQITAVLTFGNGYLTGMGNWAVAGYTGQGASPAFGQTGINKLVFSTETNTALAAVLQGGQAAASCTSNAGVKGFFTAGYNGTYISYGTKIVYSSDTTSAGPGCSFGANAEGMGLSNPAVNGYNNGGFPPGSSSVERLSFSAETLTNLGSRLTGAMRTEPGALNDGATAGFIFGGNRSSISSNVIQKMPFSTETYTNLAATLSSSVNDSNGYASKNNFGYMNNGATTTIDRLAFATDTKTTLAATTTTSQSNCGNSSYDLTI